MSSKGDNVEDLSDVCYDNSSGAQQVGSAEAVGSCEAGWSHRKKSRPRPGKRSLATEVGSNSLSSAQGNASGSSALTPCSAGAMRSPATEAGSMSMPRAEGNSSGSLALTTCSAGAMRSLASDVSGKRDCLVASCQGLLCNLGDIKEVVRENWYTLVQAAIVSVLEACSKEHVLSSEGITNEWNRVEAVLTAAMIVGNDDFCCKSELDREHACSMISWLQVNIGVSKHASRDALRWLVRKVFSDSFSSHSGQPTRLAQAEIASSAQLASEASVNETDAV